MKANISPIIIIYHKDCVDGTTAAAVALRRFPEAKSFPLAHEYSREEIELIFTEAMPGAELFTVDCGLGAKEFVSKGFSVTTIDHHIGIKESLDELARKNNTFTYIFNNDKSGASLTWSHFFPKEKEPELVKYVEDADLWRWKYGEDTKDVTNYLSMFRNNPNAVLRMFDQDLTEIKAHGRNISMYVDKEVENFVKLPSLTLTIGNNQVPAYNITTHESESGNQLSEKFNKAVAMFTIKGDRVKIGFRSKEHHTPTSLELAQILGGGGHRRASGASISLQQFLKIVV